MRSDYRLKTGARKLARYSGIFCSLVILVLLGVSDQLAAPNSLRARKAKKTASADNDITEIAQHQVSNNSVITSGNKHSNIVTVTPRDERSVCETLQNAFSDDTTTADQEDRQVVYLHSACDDGLLGNRMSRVYMAWVLAKAAGATFSYHCGHHQTNHPQDLTTTITSLLQEMHTLSNNDTDIFNSNGMLSLAEICNNCDRPHPNECMSPSLDLASDVIRRDYRSVAPKVVPTIEPSDVAIHYRCGDVLMTKNDKYGLLPHGTYARFIREQFGNDDSNATKLDDDDDDTIKTISIVTQPYDPAYLRGRDEEFGPRCKVIVEDFVSYLQKEFPRASVQVYNDPFTETIARTYARLVMAKKVTVCGPTTFCAFATMASEGTGYIYNSTLFPWMQEAAKRYDDVRLYDSPKLGHLTAKALHGGRVADMPDEDIVGWLRTN